MKKIEDYLVETTIGDVKDGKPIPFYYQGNGNADYKKMSIMVNPLFSEPIDGEVEVPGTLYNFDVFYGYMFSSNPVQSKVPIRFDKKDAIACDVYIDIENSDSNSLDPKSFNINAIGFNIHSDGITLCCSLYPNTVPKLFDSTIENVHDLWINGIKDPLTDDLNWKLYGYNHRIRNMSLIRSLIESAWNFLKGNKPIWDVRERYFIIDETAIQIWKTVIRMILNSEYTMLHQSLLNDYITELEDLLNEMEKYEQGRTGGYLNITSMRHISATDPAASVVLRLDFFDILEECNKLELLRQIPLDTRLKMIQLFNKLDKHEVVALLNHFHKGDYKSLDTMDGWEL